MNITFQPDRPHLGAAAAAIGQHAARAWAAVVTLALVAALPEAGAEEWHVSPRGNDACSGTVAEPNADRLMIVHSTRSTWMAR